MVSVPKGSEDVVSVAVPAESAEVPSTVDPLLKVTVPVAVDGVTVAVRVRDSPRNGVDEDGVRLVVVGVREAAQAVARLLTSIEPRPATIL
jgi:hypothetical protein